MTSKRKLTATALAAAMALGAPLVMADQTQSRPPAMSEQKPAQAGTPTAQQHKQMEGRSHQAAGTKAESPSATHQAVALLASDLIGKKVVNAKGEDLGEVQDLAVDIRNNRVHYAMLDMQNKMFAYPMHTLGMTADGKKVLLNVSEERLEKAPGMERNRADWDKRPARITGTYDPYWRDADTYWNERERDAKRTDRTAAAAPPVTDKGMATTDKPAADKPATTTDRTAAATPTGPTVKAEPRANQHLVWGSKLIGWNLHDSRNENSIGEVKDFVVSSKDGAVKFVAVDFNDKIGGPNAKAFDEKLHALPLDALGTREGKDDLVLKADVGKLKPAQGFDEKQLEKGLVDSSFIDKTARYADELTAAVQTSQAATR